MRVLDLAGLFSGLRFRLLLLVALACTPLVALTLHTAWEDRRSAKTGWQDKAQLLARTAARDQEKVAQSTRSMLGALAGSTPVLARNSRAAQKFLEHLYASDPRFLNLGVVSTNCEVIASAVSVPLEEAEVLKRLVRRAGKSRSMVTGEVSTNLFNGSPTLHFAQAVNVSGALQSVVFVALDLQWYNRSGSEIPAQLQRGATWVEVDSGGIIRFRSPPNVKLLGTAFTNRTVLEAGASVPAGLLEQKTRAGEDMIVAFSRLEGLISGKNSLGVLTLPASELFAEADRMLIRNLEWLAAAIAIAIVIGWVGSRTLVLRPVRAMVQSSSRLAAGDLSARIGRPHGRDELGLLTRAFNRMAEALEEREVEQQRANQKLLVLSRRLVEVQESERRHIARELHDEVGQALTAAELNLEAAMGPSINRNPKLLASAQLIRDVLEKVQDLSLNLRPSMLDDLGLEAAIRWYTRRQTELAGFKDNLELDGLPQRLDPVIETECFRIVQEALTNVVRHARARNVDVHLKVDNGQNRLELTITDDGIGFDLAAMRERAVGGESLGLLSMSERAALAGGELEVRSVREQGTRIIAWFPLRWREEKYGKLIEQNS